MSSKDGEPNEHLIKERRGTHNKNLVSWSLKGKRSVHSILKNGKISRFTLKRIHETQQLGRHGLERDQIQHSCGGRRQRGASWRVIGTQGC